jgi:hypothetical protein
VTAANSCSIGNEVPLLSLDFADGLGDSLTGAAKPREAVRADAQVYVLLAASVHVKRTRNIADESQPFRLTFLLP